jgi:hypothetical protein
MSIHELMTANVVKLKKDILKAIDSLLITKSIEEIEVGLHDFTFIDDYMSYKYNVKNKTITIEHTNSFDIMDSDVNELMELLDNVERENYETTI